MKPTVPIRGTYRDTLVDSGSRILHDGYWRPNQIVSGCFRLLAALMKGDPGSRGILCLAIGTGDKGWDGNPPTPSPCATHLTHERHRRILNPSDLTFLGPDNRPTPHPTSRLEINTRFTVKEMSAGKGLRLREFALFGGDATEEPGSGVMINQVIHPRIDLAPGTTLVRTLRLDFSGESYRQQTMGTFGAGLPLQVIDGIGKIYANALVAAGIRTLSELARITPEDHAGMVPTGKLLEFRTKARMILDFPPSLSDRSSPGDVPLGQLIESGADALTTRLEPSGGSPDKALEMHHALMSLQVAMTDDALRHHTIHELSSHSKD
ncbi:helix-hairpin-helix domain-containing protein [Desulfoluna spongiiphila]|uniref:hypothetical protein n=1 Tax=Desulfoluna spongiiphila TaxID=419481 RepID=UPI00125304E0|nr:hypothetical protein [Desulfoluna spongiiphila]VVS94481.1 hypothetical protein DBB_40530 [Desulfoluna spongiiphila]